MRCLTGGGGGARGGRGGGGISSGVRSLGFKNTVPTRGGGGGAAALGRKSSASFSESAGSAYESISPTRFSGIS